ncbi:hypothetical protein C8R41DRAFT_603056 [Lentinula lateritia]|uniref:Uncharacterized protein n=1 Tax=Lentinula lateritia TaxID=40482 RepID=A0ABQ8V2L4_9AGAR|nr:hypothetical protein C8R41DRAFT_603056 [Lentinula lateritia]
MLARTGTARQVTLVAWAFRRNREPIKQDGVILIDPTRYELQRCSRITAENHLLVKPFSPKIFQPTKKTHLRIFTTIMSPSTPKSILKRPPPLALSQSPFRASVTIVVSPGSPHVHFPSSPGLTATFTTHSPNSYDRGAIIPTIRPISGIGEVLADTEKNHVVGTEGAFTGRVWSRTKTVYGSNPSLVSREAGAKPKAKKVPPAITIIGRSVDMVSSPLRQDFLAPVEESPQRTATAANTAGKNHAQLTQAFWQSMSLDETADMTSPYNNNEDPVTSGLFSPGGMISPMIFATKEGVVWTPPRRDALFHKKDLMDMPIKSGGSRAMVMSPSPEDPFSAFPSFSAVLSLDHGKQESIIAYPPAAVTVESASERR